ncbi:MAG TPA: hypothetical protein VI282_18015, partial [Verrucomicrobiae bacterium]
MRMKVLGKVCSMLFVIAMLSTAVASNMTVTRTPDGGIQPQVAVDSAGTAHLIFYKGAEGGGDIFYAQEKAGEDKFSKPIKV